MYLTTNSGFLEIKFALINYIYHLNSLASFIKYLETCCEEFLYGQYRRSSFVQNFNILISLINNSKDSFCLCWSITKPFVASLQLKIQPNTSKIYWDLLLMSYFINLFSFLFIEFIWQLVDSLPGLNLEVKPVVHFPEINILRHYIL